MHAERQAARLWGVWNWIPPCTLHSCIPAAILQRGLTRRRISCQDSCQDVADGAGRKRSGLPGGSGSRCFHWGGLRWERLQQNKLQHWELDSVI